MKTNDYTIDKTITYELLYVVYIYIYMCVSKIYETFNSKRNNNLFTDIANQYISFLSFLFCFLCFR